MWSRRQFEKVAVDPAIAVRPGLGGWGDASRTAPTWSWAGVEGTVHWVPARNGPSFIEACAVMLPPGPDEFYGEPDWAAVRLKGALLEVEAVSCLRHEHGDCKDPLSELEESFLEQTARHRPQADFDDPSLEDYLKSMGRTRPLYFLLVAPAEPRPAVSSASVEASADPLALGYALILRFWPSDGAFRRVGIAKGALADFRGVKRIDANML